MKFVQKRISHLNILPLLIVIFFGILASRSLLFQRGYFNMHDDLQMMRQLMMEKCFLDGQVPCRWVPDLGYGFGFPLFNFYPPLPYLVGQIIRLFGATFVNTVKYTFALAIIGSGVGMYLLAKDLFGRIGGVLSATFYIWAPYHAVDVYVRGAMNETWALLWFPFILLYSLRLISGDKLQVRKNLVLLALSYTGLLLSHNLMVLLFTPVLAGWVMIHLWQSGNWNRLKKLVLSGLWAFGLAAFFTLPAILENKFTHIDSALVGYYDYTAHFASIKQILFSRFWGYGPSVWMEADDGMSFQVGHLHWILSLFIGLLISVRLLIMKLSIDKKHSLIDRLKVDHRLISSGYLLVVGWFSAFMIHPRSVFIWKAIPQLRFTQFPWRFLSVVIFTFSFIVGYLPGLVASWKSSKRWFVRLLITPQEVFWILLLIIFLVVSNWVYFRPEGGRMGPLTDNEKFSGAAWELQQTAGIYDYLPSGAKTAPKEPRKNLAELMEGTGKIVDEHSGTDWAEFRVDIESEKAVVRIGIFDFPGWKVFVDEVEAKKFIDKDEEWGRMYLKLPQGLHSVRVELADTGVRKLGNYLSVASWGGLFIFFISKKGKQR